MLNWLTSHLRRSVLGLSLLLLVIVGGGSLLPAFGPPRGAEAHSFYTYKWRYSRGTLLHLSYYGTAYGSDVDAAANQWFNTPTAVWFSRASTDQAQVVFRTYSNCSDSKIAYTNLGNSGGYLVKAYIYMNTCAMNPLSATDRRQAIAHELGHVLGLGHLPCWEAWTASIMKDGNWCATKTPQPHDSSDVNALYPYP